MNVRRFTARTARDALSMVRMALGGDAVVLSTKPSGDGVEVLAMAPEGMRQIEELADGNPREMSRESAREASLAPSALRDFQNSRMPTEQLMASATSAVARSAERIEPSLELPSVEDDVQRLSMSTLSFQDYVRERMLKRRQAAIAKPERVAVPEPVAEPERTSVLEQRMTEGPRPVEPRQAAPAAAPMAEPAPRREAPMVREAAPLREPPALHDTIALYPDVAAQGADAARSRREQAEMMNELRSVRGLIEQRFDALAFIEKLQRQPAQARLTQKLLDAGFSPALIRKLSDGLPADMVDESAWAGVVLERNLMTAEAESPLEDVGGVFALVGPTGVGKTTTTAKIAAAFATKYGAGNLGLITLDAYRVAAHEQLRAYGRILGVPVHTAHDRASLEDLLELLAGKKMVLIDTAGMAQRDSRTRELLDMLSHRSIQRLLVVNSASQGETIEDVVTAYRASSAKGVVLSKMDEAVKLGPALDAMIRHRLKIVGVANGQRVPEDWHRLSANALVQRALRATAGAAYKLDASDVSLVFAAPQGASSNAHAMHAPHA
jgi:flagellar biosynthesis protein FlhF